MNRQPSRDSESVWDYPRPPRLELTSQRLRVSLDDVIIAETSRAYRVLETSHPPTYYLPPDDVNMDQLVRPKERQRTLCEWKAQAIYFDVVVGAKKITKAAWGYPHPTPEFALIKDYFAFYARELECYVDGERARPQEGAFYGGWITSNLQGPFKGGPGTLGW